MTFALVSSRRTRSTSAFLSFASFALAAAAASSALRTLSFSSFSFLLSSTSFLRLAALRLRLRLALLLLALLVLLGARRRLLLLLLLQNEFSVVRTTGGGRDLAGLGSPPSRGFAPTGDRGFSASAETSPPAAEPTPPRRERHPSSAWAARAWASALSPAERRGPPPTRPRRTSRALRRCPGLRVRIRLCSEVVATAAARRGDMMDLKFPPRPLSFACLARTLRWRDFLLHLALLRLLARPRLLLLLHPLGAFDGNLSNLLLALQPLFVRSDLLVACENPESEVIARPAARVRGGGERPPTLELRRDEGGARRAAVALAGCRRAGVAPTSGISNRAGGGRRTQSRATGTPFGGRGRVSSRVRRGIDVKRRGVSAAYAEVSIGTPRGRRGRGRPRSLELAIRGGASRWCGEGRRVPVSRGRGQDASSRAGDEFRGGYSFRPSPPPC